MVFPVHGESGKGTDEVLNAKVQNTSNMSYELNLQGGKKLITVQRGDTLTGIARKYQTSITQIVKLNQIRKPDEILAGQKLWVIVPSKEKPAVQNKVNEVRKENLYYLNYVVEPVAEVRHEQIVSSAFEASSMKTVEFFVNEEKESVVAAARDKHSTTILLEPKIATPVQVANGVNTKEPSWGTAISKEDMELLARIIYAEARGENFEGQVAVAAVVLNRLDDPRFPKTIRSVIYQPGAFTAVVDKQIYLSPDDLAYRAAEAALEGMDPTGGAIYYYNPKTATDRWIKSRPVIRTIGNHTFSI